MEKEKENSKIYFVTKNMHKFSEVSLMFQNENVEFDLLHSDLDTIEIQANSCRDVALYKLKSIKEIFSVILPAVISNCQISIIRLFRL